AAIVVGGEERLGVGLHPEVALVVTAFDHECLTILPQTREELSTDPEPRRTVARSLLDPRKRQGQATHRRQGLRDSSGHLGWRASPGSQARSPVRVEEEIPTSKSSFVGGCSSSAVAQKENWVLAIWP